MKKNLTKKLMLSVLTLAFAVVSLGASTFAWFTIGGTSQSASFEASVKGGEGLDIAVTLPGVAPTEWFAAGKLPDGYVNNIIAQNAGVESIEKFNFDAVTPAAALAQATGTNNVFNSLSIQEDVTAPKVASTDTGYVAFDIHFQLSDKTSATAYKLYISNLDITGTSAAWKNDTTFKLNDTTEIGLVDCYYNVLAASRIALFAETDGTNNGNLGVYEQAAKGSTPVGSDTGYNTTGFATMKAAVADDPSTDGVDESAPAEYYGALGYFNKKAQQQWQPDTEKNTVEGTYDAFSVAVEAADISGASTVTISVLVWIEGWDAECLNAIFSQKLTVDMAFQLYQNKGTTGSPDWQPMA